MPARGSGIVCRGRMEQSDASHDRHIGVCDRLCSVHSQNSVGVKLESRHQRILPAAPNFARIIFFLQLS